MGTFFNPKSITKMQGERERERDGGSGGVVVVIVTVVMSLSLFLSIYHSIGLSFLLRIW